MEISDPLSTSGSGVASCGTVFTSVNTRTTFCFAMNDRHRTIIRIIQEPSYRFYTSEIDNPVGIGTHIICRLHNRNEKKQRKNILSFGTGKGFVH